MSCKWVGRFAAVAAASATVCLILEASSMRMHERINGVGAPQAHVGNGPNKGKPIWQADAITGVSRNRDGTFNPVAYNSDGTPIYNIDTNVVRGSHEIL